MSRVRWSVVHPAINPGSHNDAVPNLVGPPGFEPGSHPSEGCAENGTGGRIRAFTSLRQQRDIAFLFRLDLCAVRGAMPDPCTKSVADKRERVISSSGMPQATPAATG